MIRKPFASLALAVGALLLLGGSMQAQSPANVVTVSAQPAVVHHETAHAVVELQIAPGYHIYANPPTYDYLIPTSLKLAPGTSATLAPVAWPKAGVLHSSFSKKPLAVFTGSVRIPVTVHRVKPGTRTLPAILHYQACNADQCLPPRNIPFQISLRSR